ESGKQIKLLKYESDFLIPNTGELVIAHLAYISLIENICSGRGRIQATHDVHQGGFPGARRAHQSDIFPPLDGYPKSLENGQFLSTDIITLSYVLQLNQRMHGRGQIDSK